MAWQRKIPFGYQVRNGQNERCPAEANVVQAIFARYIAGASYSRIAGELSEGDVPYHRHTPVWNKNMVKRILENEDYLGNGEYPRLVSDECFLAARLRLGGRKTGAPRPGFILPIREKAVCEQCGARMIRDTKNHGNPRWLCQNMVCRTRVSIPDGELKDAVWNLLRELGGRHELLTPPNAPEGETPINLLRLENEINLGFNRGEIDLHLMKTMAFAAAAERYATLPDPTPGHRLEELRRKLEQRPAREEDLQELLTQAVKAIRLGRTITLELVNGSIMQREEEAQ